MNTNELTNKICKAASDKKAKDIITMDMKGLMFSTDYFVICSAPTATQVRAIADNIEDELDKSGVHFDHKDYGDVVAHIFRDVNRDYYALEELWNEAAITHFED